MCAGLLVAGVLRANPEAKLTDAARAAHRLGIVYGAEPDRLIEQLRRAVLDEQLVGIHVGHGPIERGCVA